MRKPLRARASAAVSPPIPAPTMMMVREDAIRRLPASGSGCDHVGQRAFRRTRCMWVERGIMTEKRRAIRADDLVLIPHVEEHVGMIEWRLSADTHEFLG